VTKVIAPIRGIRRRAACLLLVAGALQGLGQDAPKPFAGPLTSGKIQTSPAGSAEDLFLRLSRVGLDRSRVYHARNVSIDRAAFSITLQDGVIGFTEDVAGRVTGAFFEGDGEILLIPPDQVERASMTLQTGAAILEERFATGYFRFNDETFAELRPLLSPAEHAEEFVLQWNETAHNLADGDALRLLVSFSRFLPAVGSTAEPPGAPLVSGNGADQFLHARLQGRTKGIFDVYFDTNTAEQVWAGQLRTKDGVSYYDVWTSFSAATTDTPPPAGEESRARAIDIPHIRIRASIKPPTSIEAEAVLQLHVQRGGRRALVFELARTLVIKGVEADGNPVEFIHNPAMEGTQLARRGNDLVAVIFPRPLQAGQQIELRFVYGGEVLSEAGSGLLYVGARGTWYPNRGIVMSNFDLEFHYPPGWTLVATGRRVEATPETSFGAPPVSPGSQGELVSRWISERPIPVAGFNLGKFERVTAQAGDVTVETYATRSMERGFPEAEAQAVLPDPATAVDPAARPTLITPAPPSPARNAQMVTATAAHAIEVFSRRFGPFPYSKLALTQMPGNLSQGWPGLIFLSGLSFLTAQEESDLHMGRVQKALISEVIAHETAHQWWGDLIPWKDYHDQWASEALANYSSLMLFEAEDPPKFHAVMDEYRDDLLQKNKDGMSLIEDGPVTLGTRLSCSQFPDGYEAISYGRGTWLLHMLRYMLRDAERKRGAHPSADGNDPAADEPFLRTLRRVRERYQGESITTRQLLQAFEEELPHSLWYEGKKSLDWFYQGWINGTAVPRIEVRAVKYTDQAGATVVNGMILQKEAPRDLVTAVPLYASHAGKLVLLGRVFADGSETSFHLTAPAGTRKIVVDPNQTLLARTR